MIPTLLLIGFVALLIALSCAAVGDTSIIGGGIAAGEIKGNGSCLSLGRTNFAFPSDANYTPAPAVYENTILEVAAGVISTGRSLILPLTAGAVKFVWNKTGQTVTVIGATGTGVAIATVKGAWVYCDGTNWNRMSADVTP